MTDFYSDLAMYLNKDYELVKVRCSYASIELAWIFPKYEDKVIEYYRETDLYMFALSHYQTILQEKSFHEWLKGLIENFKIKTVLDFGGGIGEYTIVANKAGASVTYTDVKDSQTMDYAKWRFKKYSVNPDIKDENYTVIPEDVFFDLIVAMDVFEHLTDPIPTIESMSKHTKYLIANPELILYNKKYPEHISKYDLKPYFDLVDGYLWKSKND